MIYQEIQAKDVNSAMAEDFVNEAGEFASSIWLEREERRVNAKSFLGVLSLQIRAGETIRIIASGKDEQKAVDGLTAFFARKD